MAIYQVYLRLPDSIRSGYHLTEMVRLSIPDEQLERIQPVVDDLLVKLGALVERLPPNTDSALVFELGLEERE